MSDVAVGSHATLYAGFWRRVVAIIIDTIVLTIAQMVFGGIVGFIAGISGVGYDASAQTLSPGLVVFIYVVVIVGQWLYFALLESGSAQATLGKMALSIKVTDLSGNQIGFGQATGRYFGKIISSLILCIGFMMAGWTEKKQALHDMMAGTLVVRKL
jgi:uncharacterized RDD family membrane protein YckC